MRHRAPSEQPDERSLSSPRLPSYVVIAVMMLLLLAAGSMLGVAQSRGHDAAPVGTAGAPPCSTHEYTPGQSLDLYEPPDADGSARPTVVYFPGGGLVQRNRARIAYADRRWIIERALARGFNFVSADYPTLVDGDGNGILAGLRELARFLGEVDVVDGARLGYIGSSAGAYCVMALIADGPAPLPLAAGFMRAVHLRCQPR